MNPNFIPLDAVSTRRFNPNFDLDSIQIATPCRADWDAMQGDDQVRHCQSCAKNVYNLSTLTRAQAVRLIEEKEGHLCVQLHRRTDGTLITADCTIGVSSLRKGSRAVKSVFAAAMAAILSVFGVTSARAADPKPTATAGTPRMGDVASIRGEFMPVMNKPVVNKPVMNKPATNKSAPIMGKPVIPPRTTTVGQMVMPSVTKKSLKNHANHSSHPAAKSGASKH